MEQSIQSCKSHDELRTELSESIRNRILHHLNAIEANSREGEEADSKEVIRRMHKIQREHTIERQRKALGRHVNRLMQSFALGQEIQPDLLEPELVPVDSSDDTGLLFRVATTLWSVPVSIGYGRRMRFLVKDKFTGKLIGIFALGDPVAGLGVRDKWIGWTVQQRRERLSSVLDAYVCGAVPPYSQLLGGKLVVSLMGSKEVTDRFDKRYRYSPNNSGQYKYPRLALITVSSALGRSSLYNRVKLLGLVNLIRLDKSTRGYGTFQIPDDIFNDMRKLLALDKHKYSDGHQFGDGPNWRMRTIREVLGRIGLNTNILNHGIAREVFAQPLADNWREYLQGEEDKCVLNRPSVSEISRAAIHRWILPRSERMPGWREWSSDDREALFSDLR